MKRLLLCLLLCLAIASPTFACGGSTVAVKAKSTFWHKAKVDLEIALGIGLLVVIIYKTGHVPGLSN